MQSFCYGCFQAPMDCRCVDVAFECDPMPRGGYHDYGIKIRSERNSLITTMTCGDHVVEIPMPPESVRGTLMRIGEKMSRALTASAKAMFRGDEVRRIYWIRVAEKWMKKQTAINRRWLELVRGK